MATMMAKIGRRLKPAVRIPARRVASAPPAAILAAPPRLAPAKPLK